MKQEIHVIAKAQPEVEIPRVLIFCRSGVSFPSSACTLWLLPVQEWSSFYLVLPWRVSGEPLSSAFFPFSHVSATGITHVYRVGQKSRPLRLTAAYIFKTSNPICVIFGTIRRCFVLNTSVISISNKFIIQMAPPDIEINNDFYIQNLASPLYFNFERP